MPMPVNAAAASARHRHHCIARSRARSCRSRARRSIVTSRRHIINSPPAFESSSASSASTTDSNKNIHIHHDAQSTHQQIHLHRTTPEQQHLRAPTSLQVLWYHPSRTRARGAGYPTHRRLHFGDLSFLHIPLSLAPAALCDGSTAPPSRLHEMDAHAFSTQHQQANAESLYTPPPFKPHNNNPAANHTRTYQGKLCHVSCDAIVGWVRFQTCV